MKIYKIAQTDTENKPKSKWQRAKDRRYNLIQNRVQHFLDQHPNFADAFARANVKDEDGITVADRNEFLRKMVWKLRKFYTLTDAQMDKFIEVLQDIENSSTEEI